MARNNDIIQMGEDLGHAPEDTLRQITEVPRRPAWQRKDVDRAAEVSNQHENENHGHRVPRAGSHAWACRDCDFTI